MAVKKQIKPISEITAEPATAADGSDDAKMVENAVTIVVRRKELVERIVASSGMKPNAVKTAIDAVLKEVGDALSAGETLNMPALGRVSVKRRKVLDDGEVLICKIRRRNKKADPLASAETSMTAILDED
ncbi:MAG: HU family DNA-binding protein [Marinosulfonomonas sp.]|nr:HU family DNA-binding protein [Marinosulfonomonas sp.]